MWQTVLLLLFSPLMVLLCLLAFAIEDFIWLLFGKRRALEDTMPSTQAASVVIPNWNGKDLLEKYIPSIVTALSGNSGNEIIVVDNGSSDGSAAFLRENFPHVRTLALPKNLGFGGGSNAGFAAAANDIVVLLNSDMRVAPDFLPPLLAGFTDDTVFAVSCQIFLTDPAKRREETGLTQAWWEDGGLKVSHKEDDTVTELFPCAYGGGGSCAFDRRKFLELGGFDELLSPFYLEDTDLGFMAWKRGWKVLYQPASKVWHEHRGTIGKTFSDEHIQGVLKKNFLLFSWKNIHEWRMLGSHFFFSYASALLSLIFGNESGRPNLLGWWKAFQQLPQALISRWQARRLARIQDSEAFRRSQAGHYYDRYLAPPTVPQKPHVLFVSPYSIIPPVHGGGVFMYQTLRELAAHCEVHAIVMLDYEHEDAANRNGLPEFCASVELVVRTAPSKISFASTAPHAIGEFDIPQVRWLMQRIILQQRIDVVQLEYTPLGQYLEPYARILNVLFEHDIYFQSIARGLPFMVGTLDRLKAKFEYLRAIRFELETLPHSDLIQVCTRENRQYLEDFLPHLKGRIEDGLRAGVSVHHYPFTGAAPRKPFTMLFLGSFRHAPNQIALDWFVTEVLPHILKTCPQARLLVAGSDPPGQHKYPAAIEMLGFVEDIQPLFSGCSVFVCPIRSGSGVRVKLLEAFASGIPVVSTFVGAEGFSQKDGDICFLANDAVQFAAKVTDLLTNLSLGTELARKARLEVETNWDMPVITARLVDSYKKALGEKRSQPTA
jgi:GT2 family glycosyltransferase/glycosyltransferase involved in cell wall biosynthesis